MNKHIRPDEDGFDFSMAASLALIADAIHSPDAGTDGKARSRSVVSEVIAAGRAERFVQIDILETMVSSGADAARLLPLFDALVMRVGTHVVAGIIQKGLLAARHGGAA